MGNRDERPQNLAKWRESRKFALKIPMLMDKQDITFTHQLTNMLDGLLQEAAPDRIFLLCDDTTNRLCLPLLNGSLAMKEARLVIIPAGDVNKGIESVGLVWKALSEGGATRRSLLVNLGGGMVTDLGGFAAATFKRGIRFINVPTTLLAQVDASVGGKTGINWMGLKNEVGVFRNALHVVIDTHFLATLDTENLRSGYAEMLKHGLISDNAHWQALMDYSLDRPDLTALLPLIKRSVEVKQEIVLQDPQEQGLRKALNLGHTLGHALESLFMEAGHPVLHGYAVAWGMVGELYLSHVRQGFPQSLMREAVNYILEHYGHCPIDCRQYPRVVELMRHDKKNRDGLLLCTLLSDIGKIHLDQPLTPADITESLDFLREGC